MEGASAKPRRRDGVAVFLLGAGTAFGAGNVSPVVPEIASDFDLSLTGVGLISGTIFYAGVVLGLVFAPKLAERIGGVHAMRLACVLAGAGSLIFAIAPDVAILAIGRVIAAFGLGIAPAIGPVFARETGGMARVGVFGASFQFGIGAGLVVGSLMADFGIDWRVGFVISALAGLSALPLLLRTDAKLELSRREGSGFLGLALRSARFYRLGLLFIAMFSAPLLLGAWLVHYLSVNGVLAVSVAGILSFVMFGASALLRLVGADLAARGTSPLLLRAFAPLLATAGVALIAFDTVFPVALLAVILMAAGFALPYAVMIVSAQRLYPEEPADPVAILSAVGSGIPIVLIPLFGAALSEGYGEEALIGIAAFIALCGLLNLKPANRPLRREAA